MEGMVDVHNTDREVRVEDDEVVSGQVEALVAG
jgi:hypothetical protein